MTSNRLIHSSSPYLLQHAHNPVDWYEWSEEALDKAIKEDKPILISIGYSACHWCHVMEKESFENKDIAKLMNEFFVCIKVDREERPDVDQLYMEAIQAMGLNGGWPLNVFCTPHQKPFYGGTYFPPQNWIQVLQNISKAYKENKNEIEESADSMTQHLLQLDTTRFIQIAEEKELSADLQQVYKKLEDKFDRDWGGLLKAPKFVMPSIWSWMLRYHHISKNEDALNQTLLSLKKMSMGGLYDQAGGGFARYAVDAQWFAPHFEKMLYDNAQLLSLYAEAYAITGDDAFKEIVNETFLWIKNEMRNPDGGFYSAIDADSEGVEGKFYVWKYEEIEKVLGDNASLFIDYYNIKKNGNWEEGENILFRTSFDEDFLKEKKLDLAQWKTILREAKSKLYSERKQRIPPALDDKIITSWNAMTICGLLDAYQFIQDEVYLETALHNIRFLESRLLENGVVYRSFKNKRSKVQGFLDDYAYLIQAYIKLYQASFDEKYIYKAEALIKTCLQEFYDSADGFFFYNSSKAEQLLARKKELFDNVIPSSNALMAQNLFHAGTLLDNDNWKMMASKMCQSLGQLIINEPNYMSHWGIVWTEIRKGMYEVVFAGNNSIGLHREFAKNYQPFTLRTGNPGKATLPLLRDKAMMGGNTTIYVCKDKTCKLPVHQVTEALKQLV